MSRRQLLLLDPEAEQQRRWRRHAALGRYMRQSISDVGRMLVTDCDAYLQELAEMFARENGSGAQSQAEDDL